MNKKLESIILLCVLFVMSSFIGFIITNFDYRDKGKNSGIEKEIIEAEDIDVEKVGSVEFKEKEVVNAEIKKESTESTESTCEKENTKSTENVEKEIEKKEKYKASFYLSNYERNVTECMVMGESGGEPYDGQVLVAQCILNACLRDGLQPSEVKTKYKYSGWNNNPSKSVKNAVSAVFDEGYKLTNEPILYFYAFKHSSSGWHETQRFVIEIGGHRFFARWDG